MEFLKQQYPCLSSFVEDEDYLEDMCNNWILWHSTMGHNGWKLVLTTAACGGKFNCDVKR